jgi:hypothetical protein
VSQDAGGFEAVRAGARKLHNAGLLACLLGVILLVWGRFATGAPALAIWLGLGVILLGWALFAVAIARRIAGLKAHPSTVKDS